LAGWSVGEAEKRAFGSPINIQSTSKMKNALLLCVAIIVALVFGGCANQNGSASRASTTERGTSPGVAGTGGGGGGGGPIKTLP
jgi:hypothetical protein